MAKGQKPRRYAPEVRERAVRLVKDHLHEYESQWAAIRSIAEKIGCSSEALRHWVDLTRFGGHRVYGACRRASSCRSYSAGLT